ncbi:Uncharacterized protein Adt_39271 [Abeliophyllum distichum]|uniref:Zinc finger PMZ-type domain-containing protein n=1 Tax=Abeliophyllum distichum TaxID=126358 RepID=A0ABD1Q4L8_9LAMI
MTRACRRWDLTGILCSHAVAAMLDGRIEPWRYVHECYRVQTYFNFYENIINPINGMKLWPPVNVFPLPFSLPCVIKPRGWLVPKRRRKHKKRMRQQEEYVITRSSSKARLKNHRTVIITCIICGGKGHSKKYHQRQYAAKEEWLAHDLDSTSSQWSSQRDKGSSRAKLVPKRPNTSLGDEVEPLPPPPSEFHFIPTHGIDLTNDAHRLHQLTYAFCTLAGAKCIGFFTPARSSSAIFTR